MAGRGEEQAAEGRQAAAAAAALACALLAIGLPCRLDQRDVTIVQEALQEGAEAWSVGAAHAVLRGSLAQQTCASHHGGDEADGLALPPLLPAPRSHFRSGAEHLGRWAAHGAS